MEQNKYTRGRRVRRCLMLAAVIVVIASLAVAVSASGLFRTVTLWINGEQVDPAQYIDENGVMTVETEDEDGEIYVEYVIGESGDEISLETKNGEFVKTIGKVPDIRGSYETENGRDYLILEDADTGEQERFDITDRMTDGVYQDTLEVFGCRCAVDLRTEGDSVNIGLSVEAPEE